MSLLSEYVSALLQAVDDGDGGRCIVGTVRHKKGFSGEDDPDDDGWVAATVEGCK